MSFCKIENIPNVEIKQRSVSNPHPWQRTNPMIKMMVSVGSPVAVGNLMQNMRWTRYS